MDITPPKSDRGIQRLKQANRKGNVHEPDAIVAYPPIESSETHHETGVKPGGERRMGQRRQVQRRQQETETQYDTRSGIDRRTDGRRHEDRREEADTPVGESGKPRIDEKA